MRIKVTPRQNSPSPGRCRSCRASEVSIRKAPALQDQSSQQRSQSQESEAEPQVTPVPATSGGPRPAQGVKHLTMFSDKQNWKVGLFDVDWFSWIWGLDEDVLNYEIYIYIMTYTDSMIFCDLL